MPRLGFDDDRASSSTNATTLGPWAGLKDSAAPVGDNRDAIDLLSCPWLSLVMGWVEDALNKYADGRDLDPSAAKELLSAYPELWKQWQAKVYAPDALERMGTGGIERYHSRVYLERVVAEHLHLTAGGDCPDAALETRCAEIAGRSPQVATERKEWLSDPWVRAGWSQKTLARYYDPEWLEGYVSTCLEDPYSPRSLEASEKAREVRLLLSQGGTLSSVDPETGEEECVIEVAEPRPEDLADFN